MGGVGECRWEAPCEATLTEGDGVSILCVWTQALHAPVPKIAPIGGVPVLLPERNLDARAGDQLGHEHLHPMRWFSALAINLRHPQMLAAPR